MASEKKVFDIILHSLQPEFEVRTISALEVIVGDEGIIVVEHLATDEQDERVGNFRRYDYANMEIPHSAFTERNEGIMKTAVYPGS